MGGSLPGTWVASEAEFADLDGCLLQLGVFEQPQTALVFVVGFRPGEGFTAFRNGFFAGVGAELDEQPGIAVREEVETGDGLAFEAFVIDDRALEAFDRDGVEVAPVWGAVAGVEDGGVARR